MSPVRMLWDYAILVCILYNCITVPLTVAFEDALKLDGTRAARRAEAPPAVCRRYWTQVRQPAPSPVELR